MSDQTNAVAEITASSLVVVPPTAEQALRDLMQSNEKPFYCSFDPKTPEGAMMLFKVAQIADVDLAEQSNCQLELEHLYAAHAIKIDQETGAEIELTRIVLIDRFGKSYGCFSQGIRKAVNLMVACYGLPPWKPAVKVIVKMERLKNGHNWLTLYPAPITPADEPKRKKMETPQAG